MQLFSISIKHLYALDLLNSYTFSSAQRQKEMRRYYRQAQHKTLTVSYLDID
jgi:hypothetical protein